MKKCILTLIIFVSFIGIIFAQDISNGIQMAINFYQNNLNYDTNEVAQLNQQIQSLNAQMISFENDAATNQGQIDYLNSELPEAQSADQQVVAQQAARTSNQGVTSGAGT
jgi:peptidoglycan hydrolase CwlO-like protein